MKKQLTIIFIFFLNISFLLNGSIAKQESLSIFDTIRENLSNQYLSEKPEALIKAGQKHILFCPKILCVEVEIIEDHYQKNRLEENQDSRIPLSEEDILYPVEKDQIVLPIQDKKYNLIPRYALCKIILNSNSKNQSTKSQEEENFAHLQVKIQDDTFTASNDSFCFSSQDSSNTSSPVVNSAQTNPNINASFSKNSSFSRRKSLSQFIEEKGLGK